MQDSLFGFYMRVYCKNKPTTSNIFHCDEGEIYFARLLCWSLHYMLRIQKGEKYVGRQNGHLYFLPIRY